MQQLTFEKMLRRVVVPRRLQRLFDEAAHPIVALRTTHPAWIAPHGNSGRFSISAAQKITRRGFDSLYIRDLIAVALFKVVMNPTDSERN